jgi:hypothetical protein
MSGTLSTTPIDLPPSDNPAGLSMPSPADDFAELTATQIRGLEKE